MQQVDIRLGKCYGRCGSAWVRLRGVHVTAELWCRSLRSRYSTQLDTCLIIPFVPYLPKGNRDKKELEDLLVLEDEKAVFLRHDSRVKE